MKQNNSVCVQCFLSGKGEEEKGIVEAEVALQNGL